MRTLQDRSDRDGELLATGSAKIDTFAHSTFASGLRLQFGDPLFAGVLQ